MSLSRYCQPALIFRAAIDAAAAAFLPLLLMPCYAITPDADVLRCRYAMPCYYAMLPCRQRHMPLCYRR